MRTVEFFQQERTHSLMDNMPLLFEENLILVKENPIEENPIVKSKKKKEETPAAHFKKTLVLTVLMSKIVEETNTYVRNQLAKRHVSLVYSMESIPYIVSLNLHKILLDLYLDQLESSTKG
jgi:hypothetical protein